MLPENGAQEGGHDHGSWDSPPGEGLLLCTGKNSRADHSKVKAGIHVTWAESCPSQKVRVSGLLGGG